MLLDINECELGTDDCDAERGVCNNTDGSYTCSCKPGFSGDGLNCTGMNSYSFDRCTRVVFTIFFVHADIDECHEGSDQCDSHADCSNTIGNYECTCTVGYTGNGITCGECH